METKKILRSLDAHVFTPSDDLNPFTLNALGADIVAPMTVGLKDWPINEVPGLYIEQLIATYIPGSKEYVVTSLHLRTKGNVPINSVSLRKIPIDKYKYLTVKKWLLRIFERAHEEDIYTPFNLNEQSELSSMAHEGPTSTNLDYVARIYLVSRYISDSPRKAVADAFGISPRTASNWINLAREQGHFGVGL
ncbi:helix-turn-helix domain-containing protein [Bifidobacterium aquikefiri]|uniref:helix-turn-helix domain-containing protein n=1 Tax=Bifidobacterium aquikefiri TaxID=1653207 RepID=UPI0023EFC792|nr:helix-turn-helix domain-containing protein [Bifidobacterium aquikefiri]